MSFQTPSPIGPRCRWRCSPPEPDPSSSTSTRTLLNLGVLELDVVVERLLGSVCRCRLSGSIRYTCIRSYFSLIRSRMASECSICSNCSESSSPSARMSSRPVLCSFSRAFEAELVMAGNMITSLMYSGRITKAATTPATRPNRVTRG